MICTYNRVSPKGTLVTADQLTDARTFAALHRPGDPLVLFNVWDAGTARAVEAGGARAIATGSWSVAAAHGLDDGEQLPVELALANLSRIVAAVRLPVTIDLERGYAVDANGVARTVAAAIGAGAVGCNLEDGRAEGALGEIADQAERIVQARRAADARDLPFFINARTDVFLQVPPAEHDDALLADALARTRAYTDAGADGIFLPGLVAPGLIAAAVERSDRPLNVMVTEGTPSLSVLADLGVARVSHGPGPYLAAMSFIQEASLAARSTT